MKLLILHLSDIHIRNGANACLSRLEKVAPAIANEVPDVAADDSAKPSYAVRLLDASVRLDIARINTKQVVEVHRGIQDSVFADRVLKHLVIHYFRLFHTEVSTRQALCQALDIPVEFGRQQALLNPERKRV